MDAKQETGLGDGLIIALTSYGGHMRAAQSFEWEGVLSPVTCHKLFLKDSHQHWFHGGLSGFSHTLDGTLDAIRALMAEWGVRRVMCLGSSMGGHGALLLGSLLRAERVIAIAPQVNISSTWLQEISDNRWPWKMAEIDWLGYDRLDLVPLYQDFMPPDTRIFFSVKDLLDYRHAQELTTPGLAHGLPMPEGDHEVAYELARSGLLTNLAIDFEHSN